eukprot:204977_1
MCMDADIYGSLICEYNCMRINAERYIQEIKEWIDNIEQKELNKYKKIHENLNKELNLLTHMKLKCQKMLFNDMWSKQIIENNDNNNESNNDILSLVNNCILKLNKSLLLSPNNIFDTLNINKVKN